MFDELSYDSFYVLFVYFIHMVKPWIEIKAERLKIKYEIRIKTSNIIW